MSFNMDSTGKAFEPGWFLANNEDCTRETRQISAVGVTADEDGQKIVKGGTIYPANDSTAVGIIYEDVNVTSGNMPGSVVTKGEVYSDRLAETLADDAKTALEAAGFKFTTVPAVARS